MDIAKRLFEEAQDNTESLYYKAASEIERLRGKVTAREAKIAATKGELEALKAAHQWQPIASAPNEAVILCDEDGNRWSDIGNDCNWAWSGCGKPPVKWMPLPPTDSKPVECE